MTKQPNSSTEKTQELSFEDAFARLEHILERMNSGSIPLEESLKLYTEADQLIQACNKRLNDAEQTIEVLLKNRNGELITGADQKPITQDFPYQPSRKDEPPRSS